MFQVTKECTFDAAHKIDGYNGPCARLHGHTWKARGIWRIEHKDMLGISLDFRKLKQNLHRAVVQPFDHQYLNRVMGTTKVTAETIAELVFIRLLKEDCGDYLHAVEIEETTGCVIRFLGSTKSSAPSMASTMGFEGPVRQPPLSGSRDVTSSARTAIPNGQGAPVEEANIPLTKSSNHETGENMSPLPEENLSANPLDSENSAIDSEDTV